jgi:hypothetical protein
LSRPFGSDSRRYSGGVFDIVKKEYNIMAQAKVKSYLAFAPIGCGSAWCRDSDILKAIAGVEKQVSKDWGLNIYIYDVTGCDGWHATDEGVFPTYKDRPAACTVVNGQVIEDDEKPLKRIARKVSNYYDKATHNVVRVAKPVLEYA